MKFKWSCRREKDLQDVNVIHIYDSSTFEVCALFLKSQLELKKSKQCVVLSKTQIQKAMKLKWNVQGKKYASIKWSSHLGFKSIWILC